MDNLTLMRVRELPNELFQELQALGTVDFLDTDKASLMDFEYFNLHSGYRYVLPSIASISNQEGYMTKIAKIVSNRFSNKWNRIYLTLQTDYTPLNTIDYTDTETPDITKTKGTTDSLTIERNDNGSNFVDKSGSRNNSENGEKTTTNTRNSTNTSETSNVQKNTTNLSTTTDSTNSDNVYGFNSDSPIGDRNSVQNGTQVVSGSGDNNVLDTSESSTIGIKDNDSGTESNNKENKETYSESNTTTNSSNGTESHTGKNDVTESETGTREHSYQGYRDSSPSEQIKKEIDLRQLYNLMEIVYNDVDSLITLRIY